MKQAKKHIVIIGAGVGALAASALLAKDGHRVTVLEKNSAPGGRAGVLKDKGFRFDMGPSWYLMPEVFERFFAEFGKKPQDLLKLEKPDPQYRVFFHDKTHVDIVRDLQKNIALFESIEPGAGKKLVEYLKESEQKYNISLASFLYKNMDTLFDFISKDTIENGPKLDVLSNMGAYVARFFKTQKLQQLIEYTLVFLGGAPSNTPALFSLMSHLDYNQGVLYPKGGFYKVIEAMYALCLEQGVTFHFDEPVNQIVTKENRVTSVITAKKRYSADAVIGNADYAHVESLLDDPTLKNYSDRYWQKKVPAPSAFVLYLGVKGKIPEFQHHTLYFGNDWTEHFESIFDAPSWPQNPSLYINMPSISDASVAPKGHENLMILVPIAAGLPENSAWKKQYGNFILEYIKDTMGVDLTDRIVVRHTFSVSDFSSLYNSWKGNALGGLSHTLFQSALWRSSNKSKHIRNLFFAGANTVPGIGVPPAIISGHLVRERITRLFGSD